MGVVAKGLLGFVSREGTYPAYKMYSLQHFMYIFFSLLLVFFTLNNAKQMRKEEVLRTIRKCTLFMWIMEILKIIFNLLSGNASNLNTYIPLYFCSIPLYCGIFSSFCEGKIKRLGDVFLVVGGVIGGFIYLLIPSTSAGSYPALHFITLQSFIHHGVMIYLSLLMIVTNYIELKIQDAPYYAVLVISMSTIAYIVNCYTGSNLMFVSNGLPGTIVDVLYQFNPSLYPVLVTIIQAIPPFYVVYGISKACKGKMHKEIEKEENKEVVYK